MPLRGDGRWYRNYEVGFEIQDNDVFFHGIGSSISNARQADIIFLGTSRPIFALDRLASENFERKYRLKLFNMAFAGIPSGEFSRRIIRKWQIRPKIWVIDLYAGTGEPSTEIRNSFFYQSLVSPFHESGAAEVAEYNAIHAFRNVVGRNIRWRLMSELGSLGLTTFRSAKTGSWYLDDWPGRQTKSNPPISLTSDQRCPASAEEINFAKRYVKEIGGAILLTQVPSKFSCAQRVKDIAAALSVPLLNADPSEFTSLDNGGHLDAESARKYSQILYSWIEKRPEFKQLFPQH